MSWLSSFSGISLSPTSWVEAGAAGQIILPQSPLVMIALAIFILLVSFAYYVLKTSKKINQLTKALSATQLALSKEQKVSTFGALAAAAAHELGSPLSTISLAAKEMIESLSPDSPLLEDAQLIVSQGDRCRDILAELSRSMKEDPNKSQGALPLSALIEQAAQPHILPHIKFSIHKEAPDPEPYFAITPDLLHGLGNILQNAFQFASSSVRVTLRWDKDSISALIQDDGRGYPPAVLPRLGEPQPSHHIDETRAGEYQGMGLGVFIAKTLLSQRQAEVKFYNDGGASCLIKWPSTMRLVNFEKKD